MTRQQDQGSVLQQPKLLTALGGLLADADLVSRLQISPIFIAKMLAFGTVFPKVQSTHLIISKILFTLNLVCVCF